MKRYNREKCALFRLIDVSGFPEIIKYNDENRVIDA